MHQHIYMCICASIHIIDIHMYRCMYVCMYVFVYMLCECINLGIYIGRHMSVCACMYTYMSVCIMYVCMQTYICVTR